MTKATFDKTFPTDVLSKRERVERTFNFEPVDRVAIHEQVSWNPGVISIYTGKKIEGFNYTYEDVCEVVRKTLDTCFGVSGPLGTARVTDDDGFVIQHDNWNSWIASRPFSDTAGAREYLLRRTEQMRDAKVDDEQVRAAYRENRLRLQRLVGDTVLMTSCRAGLEKCWYPVGLTLFSYLYEDEPEVISEFIEAFVTNEVRRVHAIADASLWPIACVFDDYGSKQGPIFSPAFLHEEHFPHVRRLTKAWHSHGVRVLYHNDGNWNIIIPDLVDCGVDGFSCLEPAVGMDIVELRRAWPEHVWMRGIDGVDLMERGTSQQVAQEVRRQIAETNALQTGGMLVATASEINPPIKPENFRAMIETVGEMRNPDFVSDQ